MLRQKVRVMNREVTRSVQHLFLSLFSLIECFLLFFLLFGFALRFLLSLHFLPLIWILLICRFYPMSWPILSCLGFHVQISPAMLCIIPHSLLFNNQEETIRGSYGEFETGSIIISKGHQWLLLKRWDKIFNSCREEKECTKMVIHHGPVSVHSA